MAHEQHMPVVRDTQRFRLLFTNSRPVIPEGYSAPLDYKTSRQLIAERIRELKAEQAASN